MYRIQSRHKLISLFSAMKKVGAFFKQWRVGNTHSLKNVRMASIALPIFQTCSAAPAFHEKNCLLFLSRDLTGSPPLFFPDRLLLGNCRQRRGLQKARTQISDPDSRKNSPFFTRQTYVPSLIFNRIQVISFFFYACLQVRYVYINLWRIPTHGNRKKTGPFHAKKYGFFFSLFFQGNNWHCACLGGRVHEAHGLLAPFLLLLPEKSSLLADERATDFSDVRKRGGGGGRGGDNAHLPSPVS